MLQFYFSLLGHVIAVTYYDSQQECTLRILNKTLRCLEGGGAVTERLLFLNVFRSGPQQSVQRQRSGDSKGHPRPHR